MNGGTQQTRGGSDHERNRGTAERLIQLFGVSGAGKNLISSDFVAKYQLTHELCFHDHE